jgi:hypothetical protein
MFKINYSRKTSYRNFLSARWINHPIQLRRYSALGKTPNEEENQNVVESNSISDAKIGGHRAEENIHYRRVIHRLLKKPGPKITTFAVGGTLYTVPALSVEGVGRLRYPILPLQARALIQQAELAPYGKGAID